MPVAEDQDIFAGAPKLEDYDIFAGAPPKDKVAPATYVASGAIRRAPEDEDIFSGAPSLSPAPETQKVVEGPKSILQSVFGDTVGGAMDTVGSKIIDPNRLVNRFQTAAKEASGIVQNTGRPMSASQADAQDARAAGPMLGAVAQTVHELPPIRPAETDPMYWTGKAIEKVATYLEPGAAKTAAEVVGGGVQGMSELIAGFSTPENLALLKMLPQGIAAQAVALGIFETQAILATPEQWKAFQEAPDIPTKTKIATHIIGSHLLPLLGGAKLGVEAVTGRAKGAAPEPPVPEPGKPVVESEAPPAPLTPERAPETVVSETAKVEPKSPELQTPEEFAANGGQLGTQYSVLDPAIAQGKPVNAALWSHVMYGAPKGYVRDGDVFRPFRRDLTVTSNLSTATPFEIASIAEKMTSSSDAKRDVASHIGPLFDPAGKRLEERFTDPAKAEEARLASEPQRAVLRKKYGNEITVHRAADLKPFKEGGRTVFSWTLDESIANKHAKDTDRVIVSKTVPVDEVLWFTNEHEAEILLRDSGIKPNEPTTAGPSGEGAAVEGNRGVSEAPLGEGARGVTKTVPEPVRAAVDEAPPVGSEAVGEDIKSMEAQVRATTGGVVPGETRHAMEAKAAREAPRAAPKGRFTKDDPLATDFEKKHILYQNGDVWVAPKGKDFEVIQKGATAGIVRATIGKGKGPELGLDRAVSEADKLAEVLPRVSKEVAPAEAPKVEPAAPEVEAAQEPKRSKIGQSIEAKAVEAKLTQGFEGTAEYTPLTIKEQSRKASNLVKMSPQRTRRIINGEEPLPQDIRGTALITAVEEHLTRHPDPALAHDLANSPLTSATSVAAQEMRLMAERVPDSLTANFKKIKDARRKASQDRGQTVDRVVKEIKREISRTASKRPAWEAFVRQIKC